LLARAVQPPAMSDASLRDLSGSKQSLRQAIGQLDDPRAANAAPAGRREEPGTQVSSLRWPLILIALTLLGGGAAAALLLS
jgi:hypothetical protein